MFLHRLYPRLFFFFNVGAPCWNKIQQQRDEKCERKKNASTSSEIDVWIDSKSTYPHPLTNETSFMRI